MAVTALPAQPSTRPAQNLRTDRWWIQPLLTFLGFSAFVVYSTWSAFYPHDFLALAPQTHGNKLLSPFYSPCISSHCGPGNQGTTWHLLSWWPYSAALLVVPFPLAFRATCYYYRKAYYRSFWFSPPACAVPEPHRRYTGESRFPLIIQNIHRYAWYFAIPFPIILGWEAIKSLQFHPGWGLSLGSLILFLNAFLLGAYTASCHSCRHICGGHLNAFSKGPTRYWIWRQVTKLNSHHMGLAWVSLVVVALTDVYIRLVATGAFVDPKIF